MSNRFWRAFWDTLVACGYHPFEAREESRCLELCRVAGLYDELGVDQFRDGDGNVWRVYV